MFGRFLRSFGILFGGLLLITGGGTSAVYGVILFYLAMPGGRQADSVLAPVHEAAASIGTNEIIWVVATIGVVSFVWEVRQNGLLNKEERLLAERKKEWRRQKAEENEAWQPPEEDREEESIYDELQDSTGELVLTDSTMTDEDMPSVRGVVANTDAEAYTDVRVKVQFVGEDGEVVGSGIATTKEIEPGTRWRFEVFHSESSTAVAGYRLSSPTGTQPS
jgi:hypothetical protein